MGYLWFPRGRSSPYLRSSYRSWHPHSLFSFPYRRNQNQREGMLSFFSSHSAWGQMAQQKPCFQAGKQPDPRHPLGLTVISHCGMGDPSPGSHPDTPSGLSGHGHCGVWDALYWICSYPRLALGALEPGIQAQSLRRPRGQGCLERGHRRLVSEPKKRLCLLDLESSARRCCSSCSSRLCLCLKASSGSSSRA